MGATIQALLELQEIELQVVDIRRQIAAKEKRVVAQQTRVQALQKESAAARDQTRHVQMEFDGLDLEVKSRNANVSKLREQLNSVRTNKEYAAILSEMNNARAEISRLETRQLELMEQLEARKTEFAAKDAGIASEELRLSELKSEWERSQQSFGERLNKLTALRDAAGAKLHPDVLRMFNRSSERFDGEVMARVVRTNPRKDDFVCEGCNMNVSAERANGLLSRDDINTCSNCGRILYMIKS